MFHNTDVEVIGVIQGLYYRGYTGIDDDHDSSHRDTTPNDGKKMDTSLRRFRVRIESM